MSDVMGGKNNFNSAVQGPDQSLYRDIDKDRNTAMLQTQMAQAQRARAAQTQAASAGGGATIATNQADQTRAMQNRLAGQLFQTAAGQGTTAAQLQLQQGLQAQLLQQRAQAASQGTDSNPFLAQRQLANQAAQASQATNMQAAQQQAADSAQAQNSLGSLLGTQRTQDQSVAGQQADLSQQAMLQNASMQQQASLANQAAQMQQQQINNQAQQFGMQNMLGLSAQQFAANQSLSAAQMQNDQYNNTTNAGVAGANAAAAGAYGQAITKGVMDAAAGAAHMSDENVKHNIDRNTDRDMHEFLSTLDSASYDYKNPERHGPGRHYGVMAQSAAKSKVGSTFVLPTADGLALDSRKATGAALAALAYVNRRQDALESLAKKALRRG